MRQSDEDVSRLADDLESRLKCAGARVVWFENEELFDHPKRLTEPASADEPQGCLP